MDCRHVEDLLPGYALNALDAVETAGVEEHLPSCGSCTVELRELLESVAPLSQAAVPATPPEYLKSRVLSRIPSPPNREPERTGFFARRFSLGSIALAAATLIVIVTMARLLQVSPLTCLVASVVWSRTTAWLPRALKRWPKRITNRM